MAMLMAEMGTMSKAIEDKKETKKGVVNGKKRRPSTMPKIVPTPPIEPAAPQPNGEAELIESGSAPPIRFTVYACGFIGLLEATLVIYGRGAPFARLFQLLFFHRPTTAH